jgi:hypothetical protein
MMFLVLVLLVTVYNALGAVYIDESPCIGEDSGILISSFRSPPGLLLQLQSIGIVAPSGGMTLNNNLPEKYSSFVQRQEINWSDGLLTVYVVASDPFNTSNRVSESFLMDSGAMSYHITRSMANQLSLPLIGVCNATSSTGTVSFGDIVPLRLEFPNTRLAVDVPACVLDATPMNILSKQLYADINVCQCATSVRRCP